MRYRGSADRSKAPTPSTRGTTVTAGPRRPTPTARPMPSPTPYPSPYPSPTPVPTTDPRGFMGMKKGGKVKKDRRDGIAQRGRTRA